MKIYLASRYSRYPEMMKYRADLENLGVEVTSRWINGSHEWVGDTEGAPPVSVGTQFAIEDIEDLEAADMVISFTEEPRTTATRGGRHVEFGYALGRNKIVAVVGPLENVFHCLPDVERFTTWEKCLEVIRAAQEESRAEADQGSAA
jgi:nucleoside 2-deoxyribosyltransferase